MKKKKPASLHEALKNLWKIRIVLEKNYSEKCAGWMAERIESLIDHMQYGPCAGGIPQAGRDVPVCKGDAAAIRRELPKGVRHHESLGSSGLLGRGPAGVEKLPIGEFLGMEAGLLKEWRVENGKWKIKENERIKE